MAVNVFLYRRGDSVMHRIPALAKLAFLFALCAFTFKNAAAASLHEILSRPVVIRTAICFCASATLFILSGAKWNSLRQLGFVFVIGAFVTLTRLIHIPFWFDTDGFAWGVLYTLRFFITSLAAQVVFETTSSLEITAALESVQNAVAKIVPPLKKRNPALVISLAINFIPEIFNTWNKITLAANARADKKTRRSLRVFIQETSALLSCLLHHAETKRMAVMQRSGFHHEENGT